MLYYVIYTSDDGESSLSALTKEELLATLTPNGESPADIPADKVHSKVEKQHTDLQAKEGFFIIKGKLVVPKPVEKVIRFEVD